MCPNSDSDLWKSDPRNGVLRDSKSRFNPKSKVESYRWQQDHYSLKRENPYIKGKPALPFRLSLVTV
jgi:hypothetical protein